MMELDLNADAIREKAIEKGIIQREATLNEKQIYELILLQVFQLQPLLQISLAEVSAWML
jgi:hypothetical protein